MRCSVRAESTIDDPYGLTIRRLYDTRTPKITAALIYDFDGTLAPGNMQEYDFIPAVGQSNREFWNDANSLAEEQTPT